MLAHSHLINATQADIQLSSTNIEGGPMVALFVYGGELVRMLQGLSDHLAYPAFSLSSI
jgi:hypothetical protein